MVLNVPLTLLLSELMTVIQATTMSASMTAYSTAVGPSSLDRKRTTFAKEPLIFKPPIDGNRMIELIASRIPRRNNVQVGNRSRKGNFPIPMINPRANPARPGLVIETVDDSQG
jgi:hypothetical protein